jgi:glycosyltransferase involved in cell wall biosynthesis
MKILCLTDSLNSGGAQRQLCMLAVLLKERGYDVEFMTYYDYDFYRYFLDKANIPHTIVTASNKLGRIVAVRKAIRHQKPDVVIAYLNTASLFAELAGLPKRDFALIVSERSSDLRENFATKRRFFFHRLSDAVVCNSFTQTKFVAKTAPWLAKRTTTIINCVDIYKFKPADVQTPADNEPISILVIGNFRPEKNPIALVEAIRIVARNLSQKVTVDWYGNNWFKNGSPTKDSELYLRVHKFIKDNKLDDVFRLHNFVSDITPLYQSATAFCLPSLYEGCSNVIGEAMACGKPVLASNVCDNPLLVTDGDNGFLFDPKDPQDIAAAIIRFAERSPAQLEQMGQVGRKRAEKMLSPDVFVNKYIELIEQVTAKRKRL